MDLVNIGRSRRFLRERPIRVNLFDRPRLVCDLLCLETEQTEKRRGLSTSDSLYIVIEGKARLTTGPQIEELEEQDAALVPPGVDHTITNLGPGRLTVMVLVTPKPTRAAEVRMPAGERPAGERPYGRPRREREDEVSESRQRGPRREFQGPAPERRERRPRPAVSRARRDEPEGEGPVWFPKPKPAWRPRGRPPEGGGRGATKRGADGRPEPAGGGGRRAGGPSGRQAGPGRPAPGGGRGRQAPRQSGRPGPGRNAPRTSGRRRPPAR